MMISQIGETRLTEKIKYAFASIDARVAVPIGDDGAVFSLDQNKIVASTDLMCESVHFDYAYTTPYQIGFKLITSNVSDIYAMGGFPVYLFLNIAMDKGHSEEEFDGFINGVADASRNYGTGVLGGDISSSKGVDFFSATVIGTVEKPVTRSGAKKGDSIYLTGTVGDSAAGHAYLKNSNKRISMEYNSGDHGLDKSIAYSVRRHLLPLAVNPARIIDQCNAMIDVSDGLLIDLSRICDMSEVGAVLFEEKIPVSEGTEMISAQLGLKSLDYALAGGEDYELIIISDRCESDEYVQIGEIIDEGMFLIDRSGTRNRVEPKGYLHFND